MATPGMNKAGASEALDSSLPTVYSEFLLLRDEVGVCRDVSTHYTLEPHTGTSKNINNYGRAVAYSVADAADIAQAQTLSDTTAAYTPGEVAVQMVLPASTVRRISDPDLEGRVAQILNNAYDLKEDGDGCAQFSSFTTAALGSASTVCSPGHGAAAAAGLRVGNSTANPEPAPAPLYWVIHPESAVPLAGRMVPYSNVPTGTNVYGFDGGAHLGVTVANGGVTSYGERIITRGINALGTLSGMEVRFDANIAVDASAGATGAAFSKMGFCFISEVEPRLDVDDTDKSMRGAKELNVWGSYTWGVYRAAAYGIPTTFDAALPTS